MALVLIIGLLLSGCDGGHAPATLVDGSAARPPPVALEDVSGPAIMTKSRVVTDVNANLGSPSAACAEDTRAPRAPVVVVERIGAASSSVTFAMGTGLHGCDDSPGPHEGSRHFCGISFGWLHGGRLRDPRLDIAGCRTADGDPMGFVWISPAPATRYVAVRQPGYSEIYEVRSRLPVRIATTTGVDVDAARATFDVSEHDARGSLVRRYTLDSVVAG
jgi:hypothetical protein